MKFHQATLDNGLQVIAELSPSVHSVGLGYFVRTGSRDETPDVSGVSHFLEHMAFKGNDRYSAADHDNDNAGPSDACSKAKHFRRSRYDNAGKNTRIETGGDTKTGSDDRKTCGQRPELTVV